MQWTLLSGNIVSWYFISSLSFSIYILYVFFMYSNILHEPALIEGILGSIKLSAWNLVVAHVSDGLLWDWSKSTSESDYHTKPYDWFINLIQSTIGILQRHEQSFSQKEQQWWMIWPHRFNPHRMTQILKAVDSNVLFHHCFIPFQPYISPLKIPPIVMTQTTTTTFILNNLRCMVSF